MVRDGGRRYRASMSGRGPSLATRCGLLVVAVVAAGCVPPDVALVDFPDSARPPAVTIEAPDTAGPLTMAGRHLVDRHGRSVLLRGVNAVSKSAPYVAATTNGELGPLDRRWIQASGFNVVRLGVAYSALMARPGVVDGDYVARVVDVVDRLAADGMWVQLDFHQDVFHLMPEWATPPDAVALPADPPEWLRGIGWAAAYMSPRSLRQWDAFVRGERFVVTPGDAAPRSVASLLGEAAGAIAAAVAERDHVIGIELLNEPFAGSDAPRCLLGGCPDVEGRLADRYAEMAAVVRAAAPEMPLWIEPFAPTALVGPSSLPPRPVPPTSAGAQVGLAWHLYCADTDGGETVEAPGGTALWCEHRFRVGFDSGEAMARRLAAPALLNEFGASANPLDVTLVTREADARAVSWIYWHHAGARTELDSALPDPVEAQIVRPYAQATAGRPGPAAFDPATGRFEYRYVPDHTIDAPTAIAVPARQYPDGYDVEVVGGAVTSPPGSGRLTIAAAPGATTVRVTLTRR